MSMSNALKGRRKIAWTALAAAAATPLLATVGCSAPAEKPRASNASPQTLSAAPIKPPVNSGDTVDALVLNHDGTTTPIYSKAPSPEVAVAQQLVLTQTQLTDRVLQQREQARIANLQREARGESDAEAAARDAAQANVQPAPQAAKPRNAAPRVEPKPVDAPARANAAIVDLHDAHVAYEPPAVPAAANVRADGTDVRMTSGHRGGSVGQVVSPAVIPGGVVDPVQVLTQTFSDRVGANPRDAGSQLDLQVARFLNESLHDSASIGAPMTAELSALPDEDREMISAVVDGLTNFRAVYRNERNPLATQKAAPLLEMAERIRSRTDLSVGAIALCTAVRAYGNYDPIEPLKFRSGVANTVVFYCEVDGFQSLLDEQGRWTTKLSIELRLFTATDAGLQVWDAKADPVTDVSRKRRRDFFINKKIVLPASLNPGRYILKATVKDLQQKRVAEQHIELTLEGK
jgi:hypothetical protein